LRPITTTFNLRRGNWRSIFYLSDKKKLKFKFSVQIFFDVSGVNLLSIAIAHINSDRYHACLDLREIFLSAGSSEGRGGRL
jgi:hypothetical protein